MHAVASLFRRLKVPSSFSLNFLTLVGGGKVKKGETIKIRSLCEKENCWVRRAYRMQWGRMSSFLCYISVNLSCEGLGGAVERADWSMASGIKLNCGKLGCLVFRSWYQWVRSHRPLLSHVFCKDNSSPPFLMYVPFIYFSASITLTRISGMALAPLPYSRS